MKRSPARTPPLLARRAAAAAHLVAAATLIALLAFLPAGCGNQNDSSPTTAGLAGGEITMGITSGPYYITGTQELTDGNLNYAGLPGDPIEISGRAYGGAGDSTPLADATIEIWQADDGGQYHPNTNGDAADFGTDELALRGHVVSGADGSYRFTSIYPGIYPGRCRHIHIRVSAVGYGSVFTQLIVPAREGDSQTPETDQIARSLPAINQLRFSTNDGVQTATFDFHLASD